MTEVHEPVVHPHRSPSPEPDSRVVPNSNGAFAEAALLSSSLRDAIRLYKSSARAGPDGYLNSPVFRQMRSPDGEACVRRFFAGPFAEVRTWLPEMFGLYISRFPDHPCTYIVADNLADEYGKYLGRRSIEPSHADLYRRVLDELDVPVMAETMSTPAVQNSLAAKSFRDWFRHRVVTASPDYLIGHFLAYEITDVLDFPDYSGAVKRIWPKRPDLHEFFVEHAQSNHDDSFSRELQIFYEGHQRPMVEAMAGLLDRWTRFYAEAATEVGAR